MKDVVVLDASKRFGCWNVKGKVFVRGQWIKAGFTTLAQDVEHMTYDQFVAYAERRLPECSEAMRYNPLTGDVMV